jgi:hypothetical protein
MAKLRGKSNVFGRPTQRLPGQPQAVVFNNKCKGNARLDSAMSIAYQPANLPKRKAYVGRFAPLRKPGSNPAIVRSTVTG